MLLLTILSLLTSFAHAIPTIYTKGSKFFTSDGNQFFLKGTPRSSRSHRDESPLSFC